MSTDARRSGLRPRLAVSAKTLGAYPQPPRPTCNPPSAVAPEVLVFKTSVITPQQVARLSAGLAPLGRWSFDLDDCDHVLRIEGAAGYIPAIIHFLEKHSFYCEELPD